MESVAEVLMESVANKLPVSDASAFEFMGTFSRMEYALKMAGYIVKKDGSPNWNKFAVDIAQEFDALNDPDFRKAVQFIVTEPPRKEIYTEDRGLHWVDNPPNPDEDASQQALLMVRRVRNNLFHGIKWSSVEGGSRARDQALVDASLKILHAVVELHKQVDRYYHV